MDEAIQIALANADVIRVLTGTTATSTGQTIYDPAITNTDIDAARATLIRYGRWAIRIERWRAVEYRGLSIIGK